MLKFNQSIFIYVDQRWRARHSPANTLAGRHRRRSDGEEVSIVSGTYNKKDEMRQHRGGTFHSRFWKGYKSFSVCDRKTIFKLQLGSTEDYMEAL